MSYIDGRLLRLRKENLCLKKFTLDLTLISKALDSHVDTWMGLLADFCIQELDLCIETGIGRLYDMPKILFTMESLTFLKLRGSIQLSSPLGRNAVKLSSLVELRLYEVSIDDTTIHDLIYSCRSMKVLILAFCFGFENLEICDHNKLEKVVVYNPFKNSKLKRISIKVQTLVEFEFCYNDNEGYEFIVSSVCQNLKHLSLNNISIEAKWLQRMLTSFPLLEHLLLDCCVLQEAMKVSSQALKNICIYNCENLVEAEFDAPNLQSFEYHGNTMPRLYFHSVDCYRKAELCVVVDSLSFIRLNYYLRDINFQDLTLYIPDKAISFNAEDYTGIQFTPFELNNLKLGTNGLITSTSINYAALLDCLFWNLHPRVLSLVLTGFTLEFVKGVLKCLGAEEPNCYCSENLECWRHSLKEIKAD